MSDSQNTLQNILKIANKCPPLSKERERELILLAQAKDPKALDLLVKHNLRLILKIAKGYIGRGLPYEDLVQFGTCGFIHAVVDKFEVERGWKLSTYAYQWIRQNIVRGLENDADLIRKPTQIAQERNKIRRLYRFLKEELQINPEAADIVEWYPKFYPDKEITIEKAAEIGRAFMEPSSLHAQISGHEAEDLTLLDILPSEGAHYKIDDDVTLSKEKELITKCLEILTEEERKIIIFKYGLMPDTKERTDADTGRAFGISSDQVRKLEKIIFNKIRIHISREESGLDDGHASKDFRVMLMSAGENRYEVILILRDLFPLNKIQQILGDLPKPVMEDVSYKNGSDLANKLKQAGADVSVVRKK